LIFAKASWEIGFEDPNGKEDLQSLVSQTLSVGFEATDDESARCKARLLLEAFESRLPQK